MSRSPPQSAGGVALVDLKVWRGQFNDKRVQYSPSFASETAKIRPEGRELVQTERACAGGCGGCVVWKMARLLSKFGPRLVQGMSPATYDAPTAVGTAQMVERLLRERVVVHPPIHGMSRV